MDTATQNLTVQLQADLDLSGCAFTGLPVFSGHFDGQGHTISGLALADGSSVQGFFRYLEATAVVEDLHLQGSVGGSDATVQGLLAGENRGLVRGCSASGQAEAGGLVGRNESSGQIVNCRSTATVQADRMAGGVAGQLEPVLALQYDGGRLDDLYSELDALQGEMDTLLTHTDTGGDSISAALSALTDATRTAKDSTGALADGMVSWADDGIAAVNSTASRFSWAINQLGPVLDSVGTALAQADAAGAALEQLLQDASLAAGWSEDAKAQWQTAVEAFAAARSRARDALEQAYAALQARQAALGDDEASSAAWARLAEALNTLQTAAGQVQDAADTLEGLLDNLGSATEPADRPQELENLYQALLSCQQARNTMLEARDAIRSQLESDAPDLNTLLTAAEDGLQAAAQAASATQELLTALDTLADSLTPDETEALRAQIEALQTETEAFRTALEQVHAAVKALQDQIQGSESEISAAWDELRAAAEQLYAAGDDLNTGLDALSAAADALQPAFSAGSETLPADLAALKASLQTASQALRSAVSGIGTVTAGLAGQPVVSVPSLDSAVGEQSDALNDSLDRLLDGFDTLNIAVSAAGDTLTCDLRAVNDRLGRVISAVRALTASPDAGGSDTIFVDVSLDQAEQRLQEQGDGCLVNAANTGEVKGDSRAGGIVGSLANELDTDPAAHWQQQGDGSTLSAEVQLCLIVLDCRNSGTVTARKAEAGGIAGRMDFGYTADCENTGDVTGASQVGGVAGSSAGVLESCWVRCALTGSEEVGGVAGYGGETPQVLVDGSFSPQAKVTVTTAETSFSDADGRTHSGLAYTITVTDPVFGAPDCTVHFRKPNTAARYTLWIQQDDTWIEQRSQVDGSYLLIQCPGGQITFVAEETTANVWLVFLIAAGVLLAAAVFVILWRRHTRKPHHTPPKAEN